MTIFLMETFQTCSLHTSSDKAVSFQKKRALFLVKCTSLAFQHIVMNCASITSPFVLKTVAISSLVNMHLFFISGFYRPYSVSCSARQVFSFDQSKFNAGFLRGRSAEFLSHQVCTRLLHQPRSDGLETAPPQSSTSGLLMCLSPQVHSLMWRDWFLNGCFSSQRNTYFQSLIRELLGFARRHVSPSGLGQVETLQQMRSGSHAQDWLICISVFFFLLVDNRHSVSNVLHQVLCQCVAGLDASCEMAYAEFLADGGVHQIFIVFVNFFSQWFFFSVVT